MTLSAIENASRLAWPVLEEANSPFGILRFARGSSRRSNCLSVCPETNREWAQLRIEAEAFYRRHRQPAVVRIIQSSRDDAKIELELDAYLATHAYEKMAPTAVMGLALAARPVQLRSQAVSVCEQVSRATWVQSWLELQKRPAPEFAIQLAILERLQQPHCFLVHMNSAGRPVSCGMAVYSGELLGVFGIATQKEQQGKGFATNLVRSLLQWGEAQGANLAYLQVESANKPAMAVYEKIGFTRMYHYWYREKQLDFGGNSRP